MLLLCSNNYLGLADHPQGARGRGRRGRALGHRRRRLAAGLGDHGAARSGSSERLADFHGTEAALLFGSGYLANTGIVAALARRGDVVFSDELNHASIIDGCRLSPGRDVRLPPSRPRAPRLGAAAAPAPRRADRHRRPLLDGRRRRAAAGLRELATAPRLQADGRRGARHRRARPRRPRHGRRGGADRGGRRPRRHARQVAGSYGAYACASARSRELLVNTARPLIFSTGLPPPCVGAAEAALGVMRERPGIVEQLRANARDPARGARRRTGLDLRRLAHPDRPGAWSATPDRAVALCERALERGVFAQAIRPPTVPEGTSRLRLTVMATHSADELRGAARVIGRSARELGLAEPPSRTASPRPAASTARHRHRHRRVPAVLGPADITEIADGLWRWTARPSRVERGAQARKRRGLAARGGERRVRGAGCARADRPAGARRPPTRSGAGWTGAPPSARAWRSLTHAPVAPPQPRRRRRALLGASTSRARERLPAGRRGRSRSAGPARRCSGCRDARALVAGDRLARRRARRAAPVPAVLARLPAARMRRRRAARRASSRCSTCPSSASSSRTASPS